MSEIFDSFRDALPYVKPIVMAIGVALGLIAAAAGMYVVRAAVGPMWRALQWMFAYRQGERPGELIAGIVFGARMLAWAGLIGVGVWFLVH